MNKDDIYPRLSAAGLLLLAALAGPALAQAQSYPAKPIRMVSGFPPGGPSDLVARTIAQKLAASLAQPVVVENRPGLGGVIATEQVAKSPPDGYTIIHGTIGGVAVAMSLVPNRGYDTLRDFAPITQTVFVTNILIVHPSVPARSVKELLALARARQGRLNYGSSGSGTLPHLAGELLKLMTKVDITHVAYKGSAPSLTAVISGEVELTYANIPAISAHVKSGRLRPIANLGPQRSDQLPQVPTMAEAGVKGVEVVVWYGIFAPAATPRDVVAKLADTLGRAARSPDIRQKLLDLGAEPVGNTPEEFGKLFREEVARWAEVVKVSGARAD